MYLHSKKLNLEGWERREAFLAFKDFDFPYSVVGTEIEITESLRHWKMFELSPYLALVYAVCRASNAIPAFRQRIRGDSVIEYERIHADFTVPEGKEAFTIRLAEYHPEFSKFYKEASNPEKQLTAGPGNSSQENDYWVFMSCLPWVHFNHVVQPIDKKSGSIPRIVWGRFTEKQSQVMLPISIQTHHSLVDGLHIARFLETLQELLHSPGQAFSE